MKGRAVFFTAAAIAAASAQADTGSIGARQRATVIMSEDESSRRNQEDLGYAEAIAVGGTIYVSGVVASLRPGDTDYQSAYTSAFERIDTRLRRLGATWDDVVSIMSFHTDIVAQVPEMVAVKRRYVRPPYPAWTAVGVTRLLPNSGISEITVTAVRSGATASGTPQAE